MWKHSFMTYHRKEVQPFQPALSLTILLFYWHAKAKFILQATDQVMVSDQIQWITNFRCPDNTKVSARDYSALPYSAQGWSTSDCVSKTANGSSRAKNHHAGWSDLRRSDSPCPSASKHGQLVRSSCQGFVQYGVFNNANTTTPLDNVFQCLTILMVKRIFFLVSIWDLPWSFTCACCLSSHHYAPLRRVWFYPFSLHPPIRQLTTEKMISS